ncbi:MAG: hypothetical protein IJ359_03390 [Erysipelotrichaceae bacterium]|nr:hypothetical protein [Erysipelotrichaceae bacterium]
MKYGTDKYYWDTLTKEDMLIRPTRFNNDEDMHPERSIVTCLGTWFDQGTDKAPVSYFRLMNLDSPRWAGMVRPGDGPLTKHTVLHLDDIAQKGDIMIPYQKLQSNPDVWGWGVEDPFVEVRYYEDGTITWKEGKDGSILDVKLEPFPYTFFIHVCEQFPVSTFYSNGCYLKGTYEGKPIEGIGFHDGQFVPTDKTDKETAWQKTTDYLTANCVGIREDGRKEVCFFNGEADHLVGGYWLEGEEPIVDGNVKITGNWVHLPYTDDGTCLMPTFDIQIGSKTIHFEGKWGLKGWGKEDSAENAEKGLPSFGDRHGESQCIGTFYEGDIPYKHRVWQTFIENMQAFDYKLKARGHKVID